MQMQDTPRKRGDQIGLDDEKPELAILGTRGVPAQHGGFETFAEHFSRYLVAGGRRVRVYCQTQGNGEPWRDTWQGVERIHIPVPNDGPLGTIIFDWKATRHACKEKLPQLTLGYNTALFAILPRLAGCHNAMNMDGIEWKRQKWSAPVRVWFYINEILGCLLANHLIADHPEIANHLTRWAPRSKISVLPYGADRVTESDVELIKSMGLEKDKYLLIIARPEPENSILEMVQAFSAKMRDVKLVILGNYYPQQNSFHRKVMDAASNEVVFPGAIYNLAEVRALRVNALLYLHGHQVGGTNPSLVEALGCGSAVLAHDNRFNRWVAGPDACYFRDKQGCQQALDQLLLDRTEIDNMRAASIEQHQSKFLWAPVFEGYKAVCGL